MSIVQIKQGNILEGLRAFDHVAFPLPTDSGFVTNMVGYNFIHGITDPETTTRGETLNAVLELNEFESFTAYSPKMVGDVITVKAQNGVFYHGVINHDWSEGWTARSYPATTIALDSIWSEYLARDEIRRFRSLWLGYGDRLPQRVDSSPRWTWAQGIAALASSKAEIQVYEIKPLSDII